MNVFQAPTHGCASGVYCSTRDEEDRVLITRRPMAARSDQWRCTSLGDQYTDSAKSRLASRLLYRSSHQQTCATPPATEDESIVTVSRVQNPMQNARNHTVGRRNTAFVVLHGKDFPVRRSAPVTSTDGEALTLDEFEWSDAAQCGKYWIAPRRPEVEPTESYPVSSQRKHRGVDGLTLARLQP